MELRTTRLLLREYVEDDWHRVLAYQSNPLYLRYYKWEERTPGDVQAFVQAFINWQKPEPRTKYQLGVILPETNLLIGSCGIRLSATSETTADIGYEFDPQYWGRGYATEVARMMLEFGFTRLNLHRVEASCNAANLSSAKVLEKIGMKREAHFREKQWHKGRWWDEFVYAILKDEWTPTE